MSKKAFVLLSGGIDSTTCLHIALNEFKEGSVEALSVDYGQRHSKEAEYAKRTCEHLDVPHNIINLTGVVPKTMLTDADKDIPSVSYDQITGVSPTYVPFRNGLMLSALASYVQGRADDESDEEFPKDWGIYFGAHAEDALNWAYPDCTPEFIGAMANAIFIGTYQAVRLHTPLMWLGKAEIIGVGSSLGVNWANTWSCYKGLEKHCGVCPTCRARRDGFWYAGIWDPTEYMDTPPEMASRTVKELV